MKDAFLVENEWIFLFLGKNNNNNAHKSRHGGYHGSQNVTLPLCA